LSEQKNLMHAQIMASTALAKNFGKQICDFRREVRAELGRSHEPSERSQNEQFDAEHKKHAQALGNLRTDVEELKATKADRLEIVNKTDDVNLVALKELWSVIEGLKENTELIAVEMATTKDQMVAKCSEQCTQCLADFKIDVEQLRIEAKKCNEQCINIETSCSETKYFVDRCERGIAFAALEFQEQRDELFSQLEVLGLANLSEAQEGKRSPAGTSDTRSSELSHQTHTDESWDADGERTLVDDDPSEHEIEGLRRRRAAVNQKLLALNEELKRLPH